MNILCLTLEIYPNDDRVDGPWSHSYFPSPEVSCVNFEHPKLNGCYFSIPLHNFLPT